MMIGRSRLWVMLSLGFLLACALVALVSCGGSTSTSTTQISTTTTAVQATVIIGPVSTTTTAPTTTTSTAETANTAPAPETPTSAEVQALAKKVSPSVVSVAASLKTAKGTTQVSRSGLVYSADGLIILSMGLVDPDDPALDSILDSITVTLPSGAEKKATVIGQDTGSGRLPFGIALLKIPATGLSPVSFSAETPSEGDWMLGISGVGSQQTAKEWTIIATVADLLRTSSFPLEPEPGGLFDAKGDLVGMPAANTVDPPEGLALSAASILASVKKILGQ